MLLSVPEDYGLTVQQTLAHEAAGDPPAGFDDFWSEFREEIVSLPSSWRGSIDGRVNPVEIPSVRSVRVAGRLELPDGDPRGVVVVIHGWDASDDFLPVADRWCESGAAVLRLRVRGYPPSTMDIDDLRGEWILHRIGLADSWIVRGAVADVVQSCRAARRHFGPTLPIALRGESLGAGLAVIAAAQLARLGDPPDRLAISLPDLGDWTWRMDRYCGGPGRLVNEALIAAGEDRDAIADSLMLFDAAVHARTAESPVLCMLAGRDDAVPAPAAAAVFNAFTEDRKRRFVAGFGHFDGGLTDARRHARFCEIERCYLDFANSPDSREGRQGDGALP